MISIIDIIQGKFIQEFSAISMGDVVVSITLSFLLSLFIVFIYRSTYAGVSEAALCQKVCTDGIAGNFNTCLFRLR